MRRDLVRAVAAVAASAALLPGCSSGGTAGNGEGPEATDPAGSPVLTTPLPSTTSGSAGPIVPGSVTDRLPAAARPDTAAGARAFVDFYVESINTAFEEPSASALQGLWAPQCDVCAALQTRATQFANSGQHYAGPIYRTRGSTASAQPLGQQVVVDIEQFEVATLDRDGRQIDHNLPSQARFAVSLQFTNAWQITRWAQIPTSTA